MSGTSAQASLEHLSRILDRYETGDLDRYGYDEIAGTIVYLESFRNTYSTDADLYTLCGLVSSIISYLYVARGLATPNVPRNILYYQSMNDVRSLIQQIKSLIQQIKRMQ